MAALTPRDHLAILRRATEHTPFTFDLAPGWDDPRNAPPGTRDEVGVVQHHTAGRSSLEWLKLPKGPNGKPFRAPRGGNVRGCTVLVHRDDHPVDVTLVSGVGCYHAGRHPATTLGPDRIGRNRGNGRLWGTEIESLGRREDGSVRVPDDGDGITPRQQRIAGAIAAAVVEHLGRDEANVITHADLAPQRKVDTRISTKVWRQAVYQLRQTKPTPPAVLPVVRLDELVHGRRSRSAALVRAALRDRGRWWQLRVSRTNLWSDGVERIVRRYGSQRGLTYPQALAVLGEGRYSLG